AVGSLAKLLMVPVCSTTKKREGSPGACSSCTGCWNASAGKTRWCASPGTRQLSAATSWSAGPVVPTVPEQPAAASATAKLAAAATATTSAVMVEASEALGGACE